MYPVPVHLYSVQQVCIIIIYNNNDDILFVTKLSFFFVYVGYRRICAENPCIACPPLLSPSMVIMPSSTDSCQVACKGGYHTLAVSTGQVLPASRSYDSTTILCSPCSQQTQSSTSCPSSAQCPPGYIMMGSNGICQQCVSVYECSLGMFPSECICTQCPPVPSGQVATFLSCSPPPHPLKR